MEILTVAIMVFGLVLLALLAIRHGVDSRPTIDTTKHNWW
jgi:hypothetical protein